MVVVVLAIFSLRIKLLTLESEGKLPKVTVALSFVPLRAPLAVPSTGSPIRVQRLGGIAASVVNALQIQLLNALYSKMAIMLNNWGACGRVPHCSRRLHSHFTASCVHAENHRTDTEYEDSLITKVCIFQFINSYMVLFYVAFIKSQFHVFGTIQTCDNGDCLQELCVPVTPVRLWPRHA